MRNEFKTLDQLKTQFIKADIVNIHKKVEDHSKPFQNDTSGAIVTELGDDDIQGVMQATLDHQ